MVGFDATARIASKGAEGGDYALRNGSSSDRVAVDPDVGPTRASVDEPDCGRYAPINRYPGTPRTSK
jgi:hypothetical protein